MFSERNTGRMIAAVVVLMFGAVAWASTLLGANAAVTLLGFVIASGIYIWMIRSGFMNAAESALVCGLLLLLFLLSTPAVEKVREAARRVKQGSSSMMKTEFQQSRGATS